MTQQHRIVVQGGLVLAALAALSAFVPREPVVRAERIELVSPQGVPQAVLVADSTGFSITILDARGRPVSALRLYAEPWLSVESGSGYEVAGLGAPRVRHLGK
jgi:hypothetical protein